MRLDELVPKQLQGDAVTRKLAVDPRRLRQRTPCVRRARSSENTRLQRDVVQVAGKRPSKSRLPRPVAGRRSRSPDPRRRPGRSPGGTAPLQISTGEFLSTGSSVSSWPTSRGASLGRPLGYQVATDEAGRPGCSPCPERAFTMPGIGVHHRPESVFSIARNQCSAWAGIRAGRPARRSDARRSDRVAPGQPRFRSPERSRHSDAPSWYPNPLGGRSASSQRRRSTASGLPSLRTVPPRDTPPALPSRPSRSRGGWSMAIQSREEGGEGGFEKLGVTGGGDASEKSLRQGSLGFENQHAAGFESSPERSTASTASGEIHSLDSRQACVHRAPWPSTSGRPTSGHRWTGGLPRIGRNGTKKRGGAEAPPRDT